MKKTVNIIFFFLLVATSAVAQNMPQMHRRNYPGPDWIARKAAGEQDRGPGGNYFTGEKHQLVVLAAFADNPFLGDEEATIEQWNKILNAEHLNEAPFVGSFHDYFYDQSYGKFNLFCDLQYVTVGNRERYKSTITDDENSQYLVFDVIDSLAKRDIEWSRYDWNGDGFVNQLLIIFAGQGSKFGGFGPSPDAIWPHQAWLSTRYKDGLQNAYCDPDTVRYQNQDYILDAYCVVQEISVDSTYSSFGTLCHEYSHCFGFGDLYTFGDYETPGYWDLMDNGCYNAQGFCPSSYSAHERWIMGWLTPEELTAPAVITGMPALSDQPAAYLIRNDGCQNEFYMLENRQNKGWDAALPGSGLVVFHIEYDPELWLYGMVNNGRKHYVIIGANNIASSLLHSDGWAFPYENNNALTDTTEPAAILWNDNTNGKKLMSKPITDIEVSNGLVSFQFMSESTDITMPSVVDRPQKVIRNGQLYIIIGDRTYNLQGQEIR